MTTGIQCTADPGCRYPAPPETGICHEHRRQARLPRCSARRRRGCAPPPVSSPGSASPTIKPNPAKPRSTDVLWVHRHLSRSPP
jgi:hypothetical protein